MVNSTANIKAHLQVPLARPCLDDDDVAAVVDVLRSGQLCQGPRVRQFEELLAQRVGVRSAICVSSGSAALLVAMQAMGIGQGDEVIVPDITFISTATAAVYLGATPVFCDISVGNYCMDASKVGDLISDRTKLVVPVHLGGRVAEVTSIRAIADSSGIKILEDAAAALGSSINGHAAGTLGDAAIFSFTPTKTITTAEGGVIVTDDESLAERCRLIRNFGDEGKFKWHTLGFNFRMNELSAALGIEQLRRLDDNIAQRTAIANRYDNAFADLQWIERPRIGRGEFANHQSYSVLLEEAKLGVTRDDVIEQLSHRGVESRLYYPALHRLPIFAAASDPMEDVFAIASRYEKSALCLPIFAGMTVDEQQYVIEALREVVANPTRLQSGSK